MRTSLIVTAGLALIGAACGPTSQQSADREAGRAAFVRVVNALPEGSPVDIFAGERKIFNDVKPGWALPYREVSRGMTTIRARWAGHDKDTPLAENLEMLGHREYSTVLLIPGTGRKQLEMVVFDDHEWAPAAGKVKLRLVHTVPGMSDIDLYSQGKKLLGGVDFKDESRYIEIDPITGDLELKRDDNQQTVATVSKLSLEAGRAYTILLVGKKEQPRTILLEDRVEEKPNIPAPYPGS
jgi:uncharacterized protein DUF4397